MVSISTSYQMSRSCLRRVIWRRVRCKHCKSLLLNFVEKTEWSGQSCQLIVFYFPDRIRFFSGHVSNH
jgi:hypothetical protein